MEGASRVPPPYPFPPVMYPPIPLRRLMVSHNVFKTIGLLLLLISVSACSDIQSSELSNARVEATRSLMNEKLIGAEAASSEMLALLEQEPAGESQQAQLIDAFKEARTNFKAIEFFLAYHYPGTGKKLNGPALPWIEDYDPNATIVDPEGFQVVEELLYTDEELDIEALVTEVAIMKANLKKIRQYNENTVYTDRHVFESLQLGMARMLSLGLSGFDSPVANESIRETIIVLDGFKEALAPYMGDVEPALADAVTSQIRAAQEYLGDPGHTFASFDRLTFIREYTNPLSASFYEIKKSLDIEKPRVAKALNDAPSLFEKDAFNVNFFAPPYLKETNEAQAELGHLLFFDPILSGNNQRTCASCHRPELAFTDGLTKSTAYGFEGTTKRNAPTIINAGLQPTSSYDLKTLFLEDRVTAVIHSELELQTTLSETVAKLKNSSEYMELFKKAFGEAKGDQELARQIQISISEYVRSLVGMNSEFDQYIRGESDQIDPAAHRGFNLFMGKALCGTCHFMPLYNGVVPPEYGDHEAEIIGVPEQPDTLNAKIDPDTGKYILYQYDLHRFSFKTPTVRNAALTAPYMHNGVYKTLEEVMDFYNRGGGAGIGIDLEYQTLPPDHLDLNKDEIADLVVFMESLTDTTGLTSRPNSLPVVLDPSTQQPIDRVIGGVY